MNMSAETQITLWRTDGVRLGFLDLVLHVIGTNERKSTIWVEVKVDASESEFQITNYLNHAALQTPSPAIITLGRRRVSPYVPSLKWSDVLDAIGSGPRPDEAWLRLRDFLLEEKIARPPVPTGPVDAGMSIDIIADVNKTLREALAPIRDSARVVGSGFGSVSAELSRSTMTSSPPPGLLDTA